jgi:hypothetical protein
VLFSSLSSSFFLAMESPLFFSMLLGRGRAVSGHQHPAVVPCQQGSFPLLIAVMTCVFNRACFVSFRFCSLQAGERSS